MGFEKVLKHAKRYQQEIEDDIMGEMTYYPPYESPYYTRTGTLGAGWKSRISQTAEGLILFIWNNVRYADFVQGENQQPIFTHIGWNKLVDAVERIRRSYRKDLQKIINDSLE